MDMNELLGCHQLALLRADHARTLADRRAYRDMVADYAVRIRALRRACGVALY